MDEQTTIGIDFTPAELALVRTALMLLRSTLGKEEADELEGVQAVIAKVEAARK